METQLGSKMKQPFYIQNEYAALQKVILGTAQGIKPDPDRELQRGLPATSQLYTQPDPAVTGREFSAVLEFMEKLGIEVMQPNLVESPKITDQTCPRDIGFVIDSIYFRANSRYTSRNLEHSGIKHLLSTFSSQHQIEMPKNIFLEGGDVVLAPGKVFIGLGARSTRTGILWLADQLKHHGIDREIIIVPHDVLHLDCCWNVVGPNLALWCNQATGKFSDINGNSIEIDFETILVNRKEQAALATNVLVVGPGEILARNHFHCDKVNDQIEKKYKFLVHRLSFNCVPAIGGSFRCATLPLYRS